MIVSLDNLSKHHRPCTIIRYKALILLEAFMFAFRVIIFPSDKAKLISSTIVTACFTLISCYARPYLEDAEDWTDIAGRVFLIAALGVGIALNEVVGRGGQTACHVVLAIVVIASNGMFLFVLNPLKLLRGGAKAVCETRHAAKIAGWGDAAIKKLLLCDITAITVGDVALCSPLQICELLKTHGGYDSQLPAGIFDGVTELALEGTGLSGKDPPLSLSSHNLSIAIFNIRPDVPQHRCNATGVAATAHTPRLEPRGPRSERQEARRHHHGRHRGIQKA